MHSRRSTLPVFSLSSSYRIRQSAEKTSEKCPGMTQILDCHDLLRATKKRSDVHFINREMLKQSRMGDGEEIENSTRTVDGDRIEVGSAVRREKNENVLSFIGGLSEGFPSLSQLCGLGPCLRSMT